MKISEPCVFMLAQLCCRTFLAATLWVATTALALRGLWLAPTLTGFAAAAMTFAVVAITVEAPKTTTPDADGLAPPSA